MRANAPLGIVAAAQSKAAALAAANPAQRERILGPRAKKVPLAVKPRPVFERGRYIPPSITEIITVVARIAELPVEAVLGESHRRAVVHARFAIANLAEEFAAGLSCRAVEDAMNRGDGLCAWYRERHRDRLEAFPDYMDLHAKCWSVLRAKSAEDAG